MSHPAFPTPAFLAGLDHGLGEGFELEIDQLDLELPDDDLGEAAAEELGEAVGRRLSGELEGLTAGTPVDGG